MKISKEYKWEMGHRLKNHNGDCINIHGHSYKMQVILEGEQNANGMLIDFFDLDKIILPFVKTFDHAFAVNEKDSTVIEFLENLGSKHVVIPGDPTVENLCGYFLDNLPLNELSGNIKCITIRIYETADSYAEAGIDIG